MICNRCCKERGDIVCVITDGVRQQALCPNCLAIALQNNEISFINNQNWYDDVTGKRGAVEFRSNNERYTLERRSMMRLLSRNLRKKEWLVLVQKYGNDKYMLHDDFYTEDGTAIQPMK